MTRNDEMKTVLENSTFTISGKVKNTMFAFIAIGVVGMIAGLASGSAAYAWQALLINTIFFAGISHAGLIFSVIFTITDANWGRPIKRFAEAMAAFIPVSWVLFGLLFFGAEYFFEWMDHSKVIHTKEGWLNFSFFVKRNIVLIIITGLIGWAYVKNSVRPDLSLAKQLLPEKFANKLAERIGKALDESHEAEVAIAVEKGKKLGPIYAIIYSLFTTFIAFDWMMSIDQEWFSTMFGVQYAVSSVLGASATLLIISGFARENFKLQDYITLDRYHDNAKLTFAASLLWTYMVFSQVIVIWYANLPEETPYMILRMYSNEWSPMFWVIFLMVFQIPFWGLLSRTACRSIGFSRIIAIELLAGLWLEKYFLIVPSIQENVAAGMGSHGAKVAHGVAKAAHSGLPGIKFTAFDFTTLIGVLGAFILCFLLFLEKVPAVPVSDRYFYQKGHH
ncbi:MAG: hypothetical protein ACI86H_000154 [bacterium]|jgi:hypothetical protein